MKGWDTKQRDVLEANVIGQALQIIRDEIRVRSLGGKTVKRPFISISREFGCEGTEVGLRVADILNAKGSFSDADKWVCYDRGLLEKLAEDHDLKKEMVASAETHGRNLIEQYLSKELAKKPDDYDVFQFLAGAITTLAERGNVILVGRGSSVIAQGFDNGIFVRIYASSAFKIKRVRECMPELSGDDNAVAAFIGKEGKKREDFVERFTCHSPADPKFYHLMINNAKFTVPQMADLVISCMKSKGHIV